MKFSKKSPTKNLRYSDFDLTDDDYDYTSQEPKKAGKFVKKMKDRDDKRDSRSQRGFA